jgi:hypothetical protein
MRHFFTSRPDHGDGYRQSYRQMPLSEQSPLAANKSNPQRRAQRHHLIVLALAGMVC